VRTAIANDVAGSTVAPPHRAGGQAQYILRPIPEPRNSSTQRARTWALDNLDRPLTLSRLAAQESMSSRTFIRRSGRRSAAHHSNGLLTSASSALDSCAR
jgi:transcriptional regulator GlxA family with amidase domain